MVQTLRFRIVLVVSGVVFLTAVAIAFFAQRGIEQTISDAAEQHALDLANTVLLNVETEYQSLLFHKSRTLDRRKSELRNIISLAIAHLNEHYNKQLNGQLPEFEAQLQAIKTIKRLRYDDGTGYIWINDTTKPIPRMIMHPTLPELDGQILDDPTFFSALGMDKNLFAAAVNISETLGEGYLDYLWPKPTPDGLSDQQPKISYVRLFQKWGWILGTGVYIDDIEEEVQIRLDAIIKELKNTFSKVHVAETGYMAVFNGQKEMIIHPSLAGRRFGDLINPDTGNTLADDLIKASATPEVPLDYTWDRPEFPGKYRFKKRAYVNYFEPLDWYIISTMYIDEIERPIKTLQSRTIHLTVLSLLTGIIFAIVLSKSLTNPLKKLTLAAEGIEQDGIADAQIPVSGTAETKELGLVLNKMVWAIRQVEEELRDKNRELEAFTYTVSHDLRTPLTPIMAYAQLLRDSYQEVLDESALDYLNEIEIHGEKMLEMMENFLMLAKGENLECPIEPVDVEQVVRKSAAGFYKSIAAAGVKIHIAPLPRIHVPESFLAQIFDNLIGNAIRYAGKKDDVIEVGGERFGDKVRYFVRDHGPGIPKKERTRIFEPFIRGSKQKNKPGTGVGLSTVLKLARSYGGNAWIEGTPGGGSTFVVEMKDQPWSESHAKKNQTAFSKETKTT